MFESEKQLTVFDMEEYPQFLQNDIVNQTFSPVEPEGTVEDDFNDLTEVFSFYELAKFIFRIVDFILNLI